MSHVNEGLAETNYAKAKYTGAVAPRRFSPGFDLDGVVVDSASYIIKHERLDPAKNKTWNWSKSYGRGMSEKARDYYSHPEIWAGADPMPGAVEGFAEFRHSPIWTPPVWISNVSSEYVRLREWWLDYHFGAPTGSVISVLTPEEKVLLALVLGLTHFVEDKIQTANAMAEAGITSYLVESTYMTDDGTISVDPRVIVVPSFRDGIRDILSAARESADLSHA